MRKQNEDENLLRRAPLYRQAADLLRGKLLDLEPGTYLPPERLLSAQYGISITTLREAVRILSAEGLVTRLQGKGTVVNERQPSVSGAVALLIHHDISHPYASPSYLQTALEVQSLLDLEGVSSRLFFSRRAPGLEQNDFHCPEFFEELEAGRVIAVVGILLAANSPWFDDLAARGVPFAGVGHGKPYGVTSDQRAFLRAAIDELVARGKRNIGMLSWKGYAADPAKHQSEFRTLMKATGLPVTEEWLKNDIYPAQEGAGWEAFREVWLAKEQKPDGLIVTDDYFLSGLTAALTELQIEVPRQLELAVQISNVPFARGRFPIIAWHHAPARTAAPLASMVLKLLRGEAVSPKRVSVPPLRSAELDRPLPRLTSGIA